MAEPKVVARLKAAIAALRKPEALRRCAPFCTAERRLAELLSATPTVVYSARLDEELSVSFISPNVRELTGYEAHSFMAQRSFWISNIHPEDHPDIHAAIGTLREKGRVAVEFRFRRKDGSWLWTRDEARLMRGPDGEPVEVVGSWQDITESRLSQDALAASDAQLRTTQRALTDAIESSDDAFSLFDADDRLLICNSRFRSTYPTIADLIKPGVDLQTLLIASAKRGQYKGVTPDLAEEWARERLNRHLSAPGVFEQRLADGRVLEILERRTADGGRVAIRRDVTARKRVEDALRHELALEQSLIDALPFPVFLKDRQGCFLGCNTKFADILGMPRHKIIGINARDVLSPDKVEEFSRGELELLANPGLVQNYETTGRWTDGSLRRIDIVKGTLTDEQGKVACFIGTLIDLTGVKRAEEQLVQAAKLATLGQIASEVAHELNQPLSIIRMSAESCLQRQADGNLSAERLHRGLSTIVAQVARMAEMVDHLRSFSRVESGTKRPFALGPVVSSASRLLSPHFQLDGIDLVIDFGEASGEVCGQPNQIEQVVLNLLANARDAVREHCSPGKGRVQVRLTEEDGWTHLTVADNGGGIPDALWSTVFEPFFTTKAAGLGTGLGLSISANIVSAMGGRIEGCNQGGGACFTVSLPLDSVEGQATEVAAESVAPYAYCAPSPAPTSQRGLVLVVDDEELAVECIAEFLQGRGFEVISATSPGPALELARKQRVDLLVSDIRMPGMQGSVLLERLRSRIPDLPAILMTGGPIPAEPVMPGTVVLRKPLALGQLALHVETLLAERASK